MPRQEEAYGQQAGTAWNIGEGSSEIIQKRLYSGI